MKPPNNELKKYRKSIDQINHELARLLIARFKSTQKIAQLKLKNKIKISDPLRESEMLKDFLKNFPPPARAEAEKIFRQVLKSSKNLMKSKHSG